MSFNKIMNVWFETKDETGEYENMSNLREGRLTDPEAMDAYQQKFKDGCCGQIDEIITDDCGRLWAVGFDYGH
jgi:hypothetical protein